MKNFWTLVVDENDDTSIQVKKKSLEKNGKIGSLRQTDGLSKEFSRILLIRDLPEESPACLRKMENCFIGFFGRRDPITLIELESCLSLSFKCVIL